MTRLWEENKALLFVMGACVLLLLIVRPNLLSTKEPPLARWLGVAWKSRYDRLKQKEAKIKKRWEEFYPPGDSPLIRDIEREYKQSNRNLRENFEQYVRALAFVPPRPFRDPGSGDKGMYFRDTLDRTRGALLWYCSLRFVNVRKDLGFGRFDKEGVVPSPGEVPGLLRRLAITERFVKLCADSGVTHTTIEAHLPQRDAGTRGRHPLLYEYPMKVKLRTGYRSFTRLLEALNGRLCHVRDVEHNEMRRVDEKVTLDCGSDHGLRPGDSFTILKTTEGQPCRLTYAGRVTVTRVFKNHAVAAVDEKSLEYDPREYDPMDAATRQARRIQPGDLATTASFRISDVTVNAHLGRILQRDEEGIPTKIAPHVLEVTCVVSAIAFDPNTEPITVANVNRITGGRIRPRAAQKRPRKTLTRTQRRSY